MACRPPASPGYGLALTKTVCKRHEPLRLQAGALHSVRVGAALTLCFVSKLQVLANCRLCAAHALRALGRQTVVACTAAREEQ